MCYISTQNSRDEISGAWRIKSKRKVGIKYSICVKSLPTSKRMIKIGQMNKELQHSQIKVQSKFSLKLINFKLELLFSFFLIKVL